MSTLSINIAEQQLELHPSGVVFWKEKQMLLISDVHLGKISHFRKYGAAVPQKAIKHNFDLLDNICHFYKPKSICFLGDLFHSHINNEWHLFENWVRSIGIKILLVAGNHDIISPLKFEALGIKIIDELVCGPFLLTHHPEERQGLFNLSGHIHPAIRLKGNGKQSMRLPCFFKNTNQMILPAFGNFTGSHVLKKKKTDEVYAIADTVVIKI